MPIVIAFEDEASDLTCHGNIHMIDLFGKNIAQDIVADGKPVRQRAGKFLVDEHEFTVNFCPNQIQFKWRSDTVGSQFCESEMFFDVERKLCPAQQRIQRQRSVTMYRDNAEFGIVVVQSMNDFDIA